MLIAPILAKGFWLSAPYRDGGAYFGFQSIWSATSPILVPRGSDVAPQLNPAVRIPLDETLMVLFLKYVWLEPSPKRTSFCGPMALVHIRIHQTCRDILCITPFAAWQTLPYLSIRSMAKPLVTTYHMRRSNSDSIDNILADP